ncbi:hypothetical protein J2W69_002378 [Rheinheimera soli]|uniref:Uncharacterized protein n=1 Tax=Rheinheimera soli TaxID=443616 RepID=A0ABU1W0I2_9GAMM|nr:hypothetical protein [Rheinheimera soli]
MFACIRIQNGGLSPYSRGAVESIQSDLFKSKFLRIHNGLIYFISAPILPNI